MQSNAKFTMFGKTKLVPLITYTNGQKDVPAKTNWDDSLWIERGEDWYALGSYQNNDKFNKKFQKKQKDITLLVVTRETFINAEEYKTPLEELL